MGDSLQQQVTRENLRLLGMPKREYDDGLDEIRDALGMGSDAGLREMCERVRQLRQVEVSAGRMMEGMTCR